MRALVIIRGRMAGPMIAGLLLASSAFAEDVKSPAAVKLEGPITYATVDGQPLQLDLARPAEGEGPFPALVFIHGGGWRGGHRIGYAKAIEAAAQRGYVAVTVSYRLTKADASGKLVHQFPEQVHDVKCAVRWLRANAEKYKVDPKRIGATGGSAGGHLSLMLGLTDASAKLEGDEGYGEQSSRVQAVVNIFGPTDMPHLHKTSQGAAPILEGFLGGKPDDKPEAYKASSPIEYVSKDDPPVLTIHGTADTLVPPDQAERLDQAMRNAGVPHTLMLLQGQGHGFQGEMAAKAANASFAFFDKHLKSGNQATERVPSP